MTFLSQWSSRESVLYPAHHGEKSEKLPRPQTYIATQMNICGVSNLEMEKRRLMDIDIDSESLVCVNPHEVMEKTHSPIQISPIEAPKDNPNVSQSTAEINGGVFYEPHRIKLEMDMEVFSDLSPFVFPRFMSTNSIDELNTPTFDKDAFDFGINNNNNCQSDEVFVKLEHDYYGNILSLNNSKLKDIFVDTRKTRNETTNSSEVSTVHLQTPTMNIISSEPEHESVFIQKISPTYANTSISTCNVDDRCALSVNNDKNSYSNVSSPDSQIQYTHILAPAVSASSKEIKDKSQNLTLNVNMRMPQNPFELATPSIIDTVVDLEAENFNILDIIRNEDIIANHEEILNLPSSIPIHSTTSSAKTIVITEKKPRKRLKHDDYDDDDDDDEEYIPPSKRRTNSSRKAIIDEVSDSESDSDLDLEVKYKGRPRGRPPKRTGSVSSECSKDSDASKYRELRDKNNEASRKSRLKRKLKELEMEKESDELISKNIKLKAQVEELEKMVTNFRENLFKIMIKK